MDERLNVGRALDEPNERQGQSPRQLHDLTGELLMIIGRKVGKLTEGAVTL